LVAGGRFRTACSRVAAGRRGNRPVLVVSSDAINRQPLAAESGLPRDTVSRLVTPEVGTLPALFRRALDQ
jgi:hypothetical protein